MPSRSRKKRSGKSGKSVVIDFKGVESGGRKRIPVGEYAFKVVEIEEDEGDAGPYWKVISEIQGGPHAGFKDWNNFSFSKKALWKFRGFLEACGIEIPDGRKKIRTKDLIGLEFAGAVEDDTYEGKTRSRVAEFFSLEELEESDTEEDDDEEEEESDDTEDDEEDEEEGEDEDDEVEDDEDEDEEEEEEEETPSQRKRRRQRERKKARHGKK